MNKNCVYTCITGDYDTLKNLNYRDNNFDYICFTNNREITSDFWDVIYISENLDNLTLARKIKILGHERLEKYDLTIWLDGAIQLRKPLSTFLDECCDLNEYDMIGFKHSDRDCIYDEMDACVYFYKETIENVSRLTKLLEKEKYPKHNGLIESTVLVRKNKADVKKLMKLWFEMVSKYSRRDQLSFDYCLWKNPINIKMLNMNVFDNDYFVHVGHKNVSFSKKYRVYFGKNINFNNLYEGEYEFDNGYYIAKFNLPYDCERFEFIVSPFDYLLLNDIETSIKYDYNCCSISDYKFFFRNNSLIFSGNFKNNDLISIKFKFDILDINAVFDIFNRNNCALNDKISFLEKNFIDVSDELSNVLNSKGWKFLEKLRKLKK